MVAQKIGLDSAPCPLDKAASLFPSQANRGIHGDLGHDQPDRDKVFA